MTRRAGLALFVLGGAALLTGAVRASHDVRPPRLLSETGLYAEGGLEVEARNRSFSPQYPLWSDGAAKRRWVFLPAGAAIDATDPDAWDFPDGTKFWKEFTFGARRVETRLLWKTGGRWVFGSYLWNDAQTEAVLAPEAGVRGHVEIVPGRRHSIPSVDDCRACHDGRRTEILGFTPLQLSADRDPLAPHAEPLEPDMITLATLAAEGRLHPARPEDGVRQPRIAAPTPRTRAVLGYLSANCGGCHNAASSVVSDLRLKPRSSDPQGADAVLRVLRHARTDWEVPHAPPGATRFAAPGAPEHSSIVQRMRSRRPSSQMPPLGTVIPDEEAIALIGGWIREELPLLP